MGEKWKQLNDNSITINIKREVEQMKYCKECGTEMDDNAVFCPKCGFKQQESMEKPTFISEPYPPYNNPTPVPVNTDSGSFGWSILGCCIPLAGLILFLVWKDQKPRNAKMAGIGALVSILLTVGCYILAAMVGVGAGLLSI